MTKLSDKEVLEQCIEKAIDGGWEYRGYDYQVKLDFSNLPFMQTYTSDGSEVYDLGQLSAYDIIFNHDFAKALLGEESSFIYVEYASENIDAITTYPQGTIQMPIYQFHLQQMVISPDPIDYLRTWLEENDEEKNNG